VKKYPVVVKSASIVPSRSPETSKVASRARRGEFIEAAPQIGARGFLSFSYSYTEVSAAGSTARVKSRKTAYENGRLVSEQFEGELDRDACERMIGKAQEQFADRTASLLRSFFPFLR
jgi:hypothetical protein